MTLARKTINGTLPTFLENTELMLNVSKLAALGTLLGLSALAAAPASASPTTLVFSGVASGLLLAPGNTGTGNGFDNTPFSFTYVTDTSLFQSVSDLRTTFPNAAPVSISFTGFGSGTSTNPAYFSFQPSKNTFGLTDSVTNKDVFLVQSSTPPGSGPVSITLADRDQYPLSPFQTSFGTLQFAEIHDATFSGTLSSDLAPVPEASTVVSLSLLLSLGAGTLLVTARRKKAAA